MSGLPDGLRRVTRHSPCPVCEKQDWCLVADDGSRAICQRVESGRRAGEAGWLHVLHASSHPVGRRRVAIELHRADFADAAATAAEFRDPHGPFGVAELAATLGVSAQSLVRLRVGWNGWAWTFPMSDARGATIGIRLRRKDGAKLAVKGSRQGLFLPSGIDPSERLVVVEGASDTAAALDLGFAAIGRPSCTGGVELLCSYITQAQLGEVVVFSDADRAGRDGAAALAKRLALFSRVRVAEPPTPHKDLRDWMRAGARTADVQRVFEAAERIRLTVRASS